MEMSNPSVQSAHCTASRILATLYAFAEPVCTHYDSILLYCNKYRWYNYKHALKLEQL